MSDAVVRAREIGKMFRLRANRRSALAAARELVGGGETGRDLWVLRESSFEIARGERVAVVGRNGCGKTTLLRLVAGIYQPTIGELTVLGKPRILFRSYVGFAPELPVVDNVVLFGAVHGIEREVLVEHLRAILEFSELEPLAFLPLKNLSVGQVRRLALTTFVESTSQFIILDEALDNVDADFKRRVMERLRDRLTPEKTLLMTSHDADLLSYFCSQAIWIDQAEVRMQGSVAEVMAAYEKDLGVEAQR